MRIRVEIDEALREEEVIIRAPAYSERIAAWQKLLSEGKRENERLRIRQRDREFFLRMEEILFFETESKVVYAHTADRMLETDYRLYELEELLPGSFMRISKSAIVNCSRIFSISRNIAAASEVEFGDSHKRVYVSRQYYKALKERLAERRRM